MNARTIEKRTLLTRSENSAVRHLLAELEVALDCKVVFSALIRALIRLALSEGEAIIAEAKAIEGKLFVPRRGDETALLHFEEELSHLLHRALLEGWEEEEEEEDV